MSNVSKDRPDDTHYPLEVDQPHSLSCDLCQGSVTITFGLFTSEEVVCDTCVNKQLSQWLDNPNRARYCHRPECGKIILHGMMAVYCSNQCAYMDHQANFDDIGEDTESFM